MTFGDQIVTSYQVKLTIVTRYQAIMTVVTSYQVSITIVTRCQVIITIEEIFVSALQCSKQWSDEKCNFAGGCLTSPLIVI